MSETIIFSQGSFFHGTKADLKVGDFIITGKKKNYNDDRESKYVILQELWKQQSGEQN